MFTLAPEPMLYTFNNNTSNQVEKNEQKLLAVLSSSSRQRSAYCSWCCEFIKAWTPIVTALQRIQVH